MPNTLSSLLPFDSKVISGTLANGLQYLIRENRRPENRAELRLVVKAGSILEDPDQCGLAHIVEHMAFNGSKRFKSRELINYFESIGVRYGAHLNAHTAFDETVYKLQIPMDDADICEKAFWILRDWAADLLFLPNEIERERRVGLEEWRQGRGAMARVREKLLPMVYFGSKYVDRLPIGTEDSLREFSHESLIRFYKDWYRPDLMAVLLVGDFDGKAMEEKVKQHFSDLISSANSRTREYENIPLHDESFYSVLYDKEIPQTSLTFMSKFTQPPDNSHLAYRANMIFELGVRGFNERLQILSQKPAAPFLFANGGRQQLNLTGNSDVLSVAVPTGEVERCVNGITEELCRVQQFGLTKPEFERAKKCYAANIDIAFEERETTSSRVLVKELIRSVTLKEPIPGVEYERKLVHEYLPSISLEEVNDALKNWMSSPSRVIYLVSGEQDLPSTEQLRKWHEDALLQPVTPPVQEETSKPLLEFVPKAGRVVSKKVFEEIDLHQWVLKNGATVWLKQTDFQSDRILFFSRVSGGLNLSTNEEFVSASTASQIAFRSGAGTRIG